MNELDISTIFFKIDDFCNLFETQWHSALLSEKIIYKTRPDRLHLSKIMTILIYFHYSGMKNSKHYDPYLVSYNRFVELS